MEIKKMKFKVGDRVKVSDSRTFNATITLVSDNGRYSIYDGNSTFENVKEESLELTEDIQSLLNKQLEEIRDWMHEQQYLGNDTWQEDLGKKLKLMKEDK